MRDLSASAKVGIGLDAAGRFRIAAGATDIGGAVTYFRTYYGVLTYNEGPVEVSGGFAKRSGEGINNSRSPLDGPFAAAAWTPLPWIRGHLEYSDGECLGGRAPVRTQGVDTRGMDRVCGRQPAADATRP